ncbi:hypothetical protein [Nocardiopsis gilva]|uniref:hypothetical protein n=1 Tax=Nocardiopsis gilva TaxID=280236 RepID=UPI0012FD3BD1|nr:hypothetical protein [Nocardiopsis gilva]
MDDGKDAQGRQVGRRPCARANLADILAEGRVAHVAQRFDAPTRLEPWEIEPPQTRSIIVVKPGGREAPDPSQ